MQQREVVRRHSNTKKTTLSQSVHFRHPPAAASELRLARLESTFFENSSRNITIWSPGLWCWTSLGVRAI